MTGQPEAPRLLALEAREAALKERIQVLEGALRDALCELTACAVQLAARGLKGHEGDSVSRAQTRARAALQSKTSP